MKLFKLYWNYDRCKEEALKYKYRIDYKKYSNSSYNSACKNKWLNEICSHMILINKPSGYWTKERCQEEALKYNTRNEFCKKNNNAYDAARKKNWLDEICSHMSFFGTTQKRLIYTVLFNNKHAYVGLTYNFDIRKNEHLTLKKSTVYKYIKKTNLKPYFVKLSNYVDEIEAKKLEEYYLNELKKRNYVMLNKVKTGSLGGKSIWSKNKCINEALKYNTRTDFKKYSNGAYKKARKYNWINEICSHMKQKQKPSNYWNYDKCKEESLKYKTRNIFKNNNYYVYVISRKNKWLDEFYPKKL